MKFEDLFKAEDEQITAAKTAAKTRETPVKRADLAVAQPESTDEPWVSFTNRNRVGLALSGGGIRSATFNLGLLQALEQKGLLELVDYLSTVSGGGYIGGFWTAWRKRTHESDAKGKPMLFPKQIDTKSAAPKNDPYGIKEIRERPEIRHMREFSRFLMPRVGFIYPETWDGIMAVLFGLLPSLLVTVAVIGLGLTTWLFLNAPMFGGPPWLSAGLMLLITIIVHFCTERQFLLRGAAERKERKADVSWESAVLLSVLSGVFMGLLCYKFHSSYCMSNLLEPLYVLMPALAWSLVTVIMILARLFLYRGTEHWKPVDKYRAMGLDRAIARCLVTAVVWAAFGGLWLLAVYIWKHYRDDLGYVGGSTVGLAAIFAWLRDWLVKPVEVTNLQTFLQRLKPVLPQLLAYVVVAAMVVLVSILILFIAFDEPHQGWPWLLGFFIGCALIVLLALWLFDPTSVGLHAFYRGRITRCFLGAANPKALGENSALNRQTDERLEDDLLLNEIPGSKQTGTTEASFDQVRLRPVHLICCAANNLAGDPLGSLYRGARSAVLSQRGVSLGDETADLPDTRLSSALTASAAAFNSNMGSISMHLGLPVAFLMTALNLRLGLWVPHPHSNYRKKKRLPGTFFFREMFACTKTDPKLHTKQKAHYLHLSDGAHFENLALYELVRRHCRCIIVSDCGADPNYSFDDLGNAIRRIREDFGVEIDLDLSPLKPGPDGLARQRVVTGTIYYAGLGGCDNGTLIYFKPLLTGSEPVDVLQYKTRNSVFPQEPTSDQFYNESQWEAYRRLGEHSGNEAFRFIETMEKRTDDSDPAVRAAKIFFFAKGQWQPGWQEQNEQFLDLTNRCVELETDVRDNAPAFLRAEFFAEVLKAQSPAPGMPPVEHDEQIKAVYFLMLVAQLMEDTWLACRLDTEWAHPLNEGWMSYMSRWTSTPSFRRWWPILKPLYSPGFRDFVSFRFALELEDLSRSKKNEVRESVSRLEIKEERPETAQKGFAWRQWEKLQTGQLQKTGHDHIVVLTYQLHFAELEGLPKLEPLQVGFLRAQMDRKSGIAKWDTNDFYLPAPLSGAGFTGEFLTSVVKYFEEHTTVKELRVTILDADLHDANARLRRDPASRQRRSHLVDFYQSRGFNYDRTIAADRPDGEPSLELNLLSRLLAKK